MSESDKRRLKRRHLVYYLRVLDRRTGQALGHVVDLTTKGMKIISERPVESGRLYAFAIESPPDLGGGDPAPLEAQCVWCRKDVNPAFHAVGFRFAPLPVETLHMIEDLIGDVGFED